jgi:hypothetical protein
MENLEQPESYLGVRFDSVRHTKNAEDRKRFAELAAKIPPLVKGE